MGMPQRYGGEGLGRTVGIYPPESETDFGNEEGKRRLMDEEYERMVEQVSKSEGFDIDFEKFRCEFNFKPVYLDGDFFTDEPETDVDFMNTLSEMAVDKYNEQEGTKLEFVRVQKANWHPSAAFTFYITFEVCDPCSDNQSKVYQAMVRSLAEDREVLFCRPKPHQGD